MIHKNLPNQLTLCRLFLAACFFLALNNFRYEGSAVNPQTLILLTAMVLFILAALTDWLDGYLARKWHVESRFGRIMDPFCDKVLIIGGFIYLAGPRFVIPERAAAGEFFNMISGVYPWMVAVILARELLVTSLRGEIEAGGTQFGANIWGKLKMILQSITIPTVIFIVWLDPQQRHWTAWVRDAFVYSTVLVTILSVIPYISAARRAMAAQSKDAEG